MKKLATYLSLFFLLFCFDAFSQQPGDRNTLASNETGRGRRMLRKEQRVKRSAERNLSKQEKRAHRNSKDKLHKKTLDVKIKRNKKNKEKRKDKKEPIRN